MIALERPALMPGLGGKLSSMTADLRANFLMTAHEAQSVALLAGDWPYRC